jgi:hypothetical protein
MNIYKELNIVAFAENLYELKLRFVSVASIGALNMKQNRKLLKYLILALDKSIPIIIIPSNCVLD